MSEITMIPGRFFADKDIRLLSVKNGYEVYIKRVHTEQGIRYECVADEVVTTLENVNGVYEWIEENK